MTLKVNTAEGGTNGTGVTTGNSGGASGSAWGTVSAGAGGTIVYSSTSAAQGSLCYLLTPASGVTCFLLMNDGSSGASFSVSMRVRLTGLPSSATIFLDVQAAAGGTKARLHLNTAGNLQVVNSSGTAVATSTMALALNTDYRVTFYGDVGASSAVTCKIYAGTSTTPLETVAPTGVNSGTGTAGRAIVGKFTNTGTMAPFRIDDYRQDLQTNTEFVDTTVHDAAGTITSSSTAPGSLTARLVLAGVLAVASATSGAADRVPVVHQAAGVVAASTATAGTAERVTTVQQVTGTTAASTAITGAVVARLLASASTSATTSTTGSAERVALTLAAAGSTPGTSVTTGAVNGRLPSAGSVAVTSSTDGTTTARYAVTGGAVATSGLSGSPSVIGGPQTLPTAGVTSSTTTTTGALTIRRPVAGSTPLVSGVSGEATSTALITGSTTASTSTSGDVTVLVAPVVHAAAGLVESTSATSGDATAITAPTVQPVSGNVAVISGTSGAVTVIGAQDGEPVPGAGMDLTIPDTSAGLRIPKGTVTLTAPHDLTLITPDTRLEIVQ